MKGAVTKVGLAALLACVAGVYAPGHAVASGSCSSGAVRVIHVSSARGLVAAFAAARPGDQIRLADGVYRSHFTITRKGTKAHPIVVCGSAAAVLDGGRLNGGYALHLLDTTWVRISGLTIRHGQKGVVIDGSTHVALTKLDIHDVGDEGVHFRRGTTEASITSSRIYNTGRIAPTYGEGIYVGSARSNWCSNSGCQPDAVDNISIVGNHIGPGVPVEEVDVKEGTTGGVIADNAFDGRNMTGAQAWVDIKGNKWTVRNNSGSHSAKNGFAVTLAVPGWGNNNIFTGNHAAVDASGYGFKIAQGVVGVIVYTSNVVTGAAAGACNVAEQR